MSTQMPIIESDDFEYNNELGAADIIDIQEEIEGNTKSKSSADKIQLAFYTGYHTLHTTDGNPAYYMDYPARARR